MVSVLVDVAANLLAAVDLIALEANSKAEQAYDLHQP